MQQNIKSVEVNILRQYNYQVNFKDLCCGNPPYLGIAVRQ